MYASYNRNPAWYRDARWLFGLLLFICLVLGLLFFSLADLTRDLTAGQLIEQVLDLSLPEDEAAPVSLQEAWRYQPGEPLQLLPGLELALPIARLDELDVEVARELLATSLTEQLLNEGRTALLERAADSGLEQALRSTLTTTALNLTHAQLAAALMPAGLANGNRLANWPLQAEEAPGEPVQPIVGLFIYGEPGQFERMSERDIGDYVLGELSELLLSEGVPAAQARVDNPDLASLFNEVVAGPLRDSLRDDFANLLRPFDRQIEARLTRARAQAAAPPSDERQSALGLEGLLSPSELESLSPVEARHAALEILSARMYLQGPEAARDLLSNEQHIAQLGEVTGLLERLSYTQHLRFVRQTWLFGFLSLLALAALMWFSSGWRRLLTAGFVIALAALPGLGLIRWLKPHLNDAALPLVPAKSPLPSWLELSHYLGANLPELLFVTLERHHFNLLFIGLSLIGLYISGRLFRLLRPRRGRF